MPPSEILLGLVIVAALVLYLVLGGADFGGGVWDLLAFGARRGAQRRAIEHAIGPIWEANHVWLILVVVVLFTAFPRGFAAITTALHVPLTLFLLGVVLRGSAFTFRATDLNHDRGQARWGLAFSLASIAAPWLLGATVGAIASGQIRVDPQTGVVGGGFMAPWLGPFPVAVGFFCLALCAFLAATYLTKESEDDPPLQEDFRVRALCAGLAVGVCALAAFLTAGSGASRIWQGLVHRPWTLPFHGATAAAAVGALWALWARKFHPARVLAGAQTALILIGRATAQYPYLVVPDLTIWNVAAPARTRSLLLGVLAAGIPVLVPSLWLLFRVFKAERRRT
jgi:cytochrome d ubiquinol oxidase subunit II